MSGSYAPNFSALSSGKLWALTAAALLVTCLVKGLSEKMPRTVEKRELPWVCMEAAFVEVAQRLMMQSYVIYLLDAPRSGASSSMRLSGARGSSFRESLQSRPWERILFLGSTAQFGKKSQAGFLFQFKVPKMEEYCMYFPFSELRKWSKKAAETRRRNCAVLPLI